MVCGTAASISPFHICNRHHLHSPLRGRYRSLCAATPDVAVSDGGVRSSDLEDYSAHSPAPGPSGIPLAVEHPLFTPKTARQESTKCRPIFEIERVKLEHHCPGQCSSPKSEKTPVERTDELEEPTRSLPISLGAACAAPFPSTAHFRATTPRRKNNEFQRTH